MTYRILVSTAADKALSKLSKDVRDRVVAKLREAARKDPFRFFRPLTNEDVHRLRVGDYRIIADLDREEKVVRVLGVGHRRNVYD